MRNTIRVGAARSCSCLRRLTVNGCGGARARGDRLPAKSAVNYILVINLTLISTLKIDVVIGF